MRLKVTIKRGLVADGDWTTAQIIDQEFNPEDGFNLGLGEGIMKDVTSLQIDIQKEDANAKDDRMARFYPSYRNRSNRLPKG